jgi:predicted CXXCH cytochrome family protein
MAGVWRTGIGFAMLGILAAVGFIATSCSTFETSRAVLSPPSVAGATFVGNKACAECHTNYARLFHDSPHARLRMPDDNLPGGIGCESCHGPGSLHVQAGGGQNHFIVNPGKEPGACFSCHVETHAEFNLPQHHPIPEEKMNCVQCHDPHGRDISKKSGGLTFARQNENCAQCHREQTRLVIYEHEALREGCTICHQPHGSINDKMLVQRDNNLCLKCHAQVHAVNGEIYIGSTPHTTLISRGSCWTSGCHTAVHGSNIDSKLRY